MIIEEIADKLHKLRREYCSNNTDYMTNPPKYVIYIGTATYYEMKNEIIPRIDAPCAIDSYCNDILCGVPIYRTVDHDHWEIYRKGAN